MKYFKNVLFLISLQISINAIAAPVPAAPSNAKNLAASQVGVINSASVNWQASDTLAVVGYKITYQKMTGGALPVTIRVGKVTSHTVSGLQFNEPYNFSINAFRLGVLVTDTIYSGISPTVPVTLYNLSEAPTISVAPGIDTPNRVGINITDINTFEDGFEIEYTAPAGGVVTIINYPTPITGTVQYALTGLLPKSTYAVRVRAYRGTLFKGPWSGFIYPKTLKDAPVAPVVSFLKTCPFYAGFKWDINANPEDIEYFIIQRSQDNINYSIIVNSIGAEKREYYDNGVNPNSTYFYKVVAVNSSGITQSNSIQVLTRNYERPNPPNVILSDKSLKTNNSLTFKWTNGNQDLDCRTNIREVTKILIKLDDTGDFKFLADLTPGEQNYKVTGLKPKQKVELQFVVVSDKGLTSLPVSAFDITKGPPSAASNLIGVFFKDAIANPVIGLGWKDNSDDEDYFIIEKSVGTPDNFRFMARIKQDLEGLNDVNIEEGVSYFYRVKAGSVTEGDGQYSGVVGPFFVPYSTIPNAPYGLVAKQLGLKVNLTWRDDSSKEESTIIEKSVDNGASFGLVTSVPRNAVSYTDENVSGGKTYIYRVRAVNPIGPSANSKVATITLTGSAEILDNLVMYPNPAVDNVNLRLRDNTIEDVKLNYSIFNESNKLILQKTDQALNNGELAIDKLRLTPGRYNLVISYGGSSINRRIIIL